MFESGESSERRSTSSSPESHASFGSYQSAYDPNNQTNQQAPLADETMTSNATILAQQHTPATITQQSAATSQQQQQQSTLAAMAAAIAAQQFLISAASVCGVDIAWLTNFAALAANQPLAASNFGPQTPEQLTAAAVAAAALLSNGTGPNATGAINPHLAALIGASALAGQDSSASSPPPQLPVGSQPALQLLAGSERSSPQLLQQESAAAAALQLNGSGLCWQQRQQSPPSSHQLHNHHQQAQQQPEVTDLSLGAAAQRSAGSSVLNSAAAAAVKQEQQTAGSIGDLTSHLTQQLAAAAAVQQSHAAIAAAAQRARLVQQQQQQAPVRERDSIRSHHQRNQSQANQLGSPGLNGNGSLVGLVDHNHNNNNNNNHNLNNHTNHNSTSHQTHHNARTHPHHHHLNNNYHHSSIQTQQQLLATKGFNPLAVRAGQQTEILTPTHLRKAKLMFFYVRYPNSSTLKECFRDVRFNKNNTAQLVKWFSNFREFYYIQMEKFARDAIADERIQCKEDIVVSHDHELINQLNNHYNKNRHIELPEVFRQVVEETLRHFYDAIENKRDQEQSWKKSIYKLIARLDQEVPEVFKTEAFNEHLE